MGPAGPKGGLPFCTRLVAGVQDTLKWRSPRSRICTCKCTWDSYSVQRRLTWKGRGLWSQSGNGKAQKKEGSMSLNKDSRVTLTRSQRECGRFSFSLLGVGEVCVEGQLHPMRAREKSRKKANSLFNLREKSCQVLKMGHVLCIIDRMEKKSDSVLLFGKLAWGFIWKLIGLALGWLILFNWTLLFLSVETKTTSSDFLNSMSFLIRLNFKFLYENDFDTKW